MKLENPPGLAFSCAALACQSTMHQNMNVQGEWRENLYTGETYCVASHMFDQDEKPHKLDMGIVYSDVIETFLGASIKVY